MTGQKHSGDGLLAKLRAIYDRSTEDRARAPEVVKPKPEAKPEAPYQLAREYQPRTPAIPLAAPAGVSAEEWAEAARNVAMGSAPSAIKKGSDIPNDFVLRRMGLAP
jgi:hypothetical protein